MIKGGLEIHIYDFDSTLFRSPEQPEWWDKKVLGQWYSDEVSLGIPFVDIKPPTDYWVSEVVELAKESIKDQNTWAILLTGRPDYGNLRYRIAELLGQRGLKFDEVMLKRPMGAKTTSFKRYFTEKLIHRYPLVSKIQVWEDNTDNIAVLRDLSKKKGLAFEGHLVKTTPAPLLLDLTKEEYLVYLKDQIPSKEWDYIQKRL